MLRELISGGANCHAIADNLQTPFLEVVAQGAARNFAGIEERPQEVLRSWLEGLYDCGVDLEDYGRKEVAIFEFRSWSWDDLAWHYNNHKSEPPLAWRMTSLKYGRTVEDWSISVERYKRTEYMGVQRKATIPVLNIPGSWVEEEDSSSSESLSDGSSVDDTTSDSVVAGGDDQ